MQRRRRRDQKRRLRALVHERVQILYDQAVEAARRGDLEYAARLGGLIRELSLSTRVRLPRHIRRGLCKRCNTPLIPGVTSTVRLVSQGRFSYRVIRCLNCGWIHRYPYRKGGRRGVGRGEEEGQAGPS